MEQLDDSDSRTLFVGDLFPDINELSSMKITSRLHNQFIEKFGETF